MKNKTIYLTFDDGPTPGVTPWVLSLLKQYNIKATFFCLGKNVEQWPDLIQTILKDGHTIGNHGYEHLNGWKTKTTTYVKNIYKAKELIKTSFFRPPYGKITPRQWFILKKEFRIVFWHYLSKDYLPFEKQQSFLIKLKKNSKHGKIIVFHDTEKSYPTLRAYLEKYLQWLKEENFKCVSL